MANIKQKSEKLTAFVSLIIGGICLFVSFLAVLGLMMALMAISFTISLHVFESL